MAKAKQDAGKPAGRRSGVKVTSGATPLAALKTASDSFSEARVRKVNESGARDELERARKLVAGIYAAFSASASDTTSARQRDLLTAAGTGIAFALNVAAAAELVFNAIDDRITQEAAYHAAVTAQNGQIAALDKLNVSAASKLRGEFGTTSPDLATYGVPALGQGGGKRGSKKPPPTTTT